MKIALIGTAPSSVRLAPFGDHTWMIYACSPGTYPLLPRCDKFFELHRWEPGVIGKPETQKPWYSPEYVAWLAQQRCVVMADRVPEIPNSMRLPIEALESKYGSYNWTSSLAYMMAMAIEEILTARLSRAPWQEIAENFPGTAPEQDAIGLWGVDMAATEEYGFQRSGCQFFIQIADKLGIQVIVPPESDLLVPPSYYGLCESSHMHIKLMARKRELENRLNHTMAALENAKQEQSFLRGALDDLTYHMNTWVFNGYSYAADFTGLFAQTQKPVHQDSGEPLQIQEDII